MSPSTHLRLYRLRIGAAAVSAICGGVALLGWLVGLPALAQVAPGLPPMSPCSAVCQIIAAASLAAEGARARALALGLLLAGLALAGVRLDEGAAALLALLGPLPPLITAINIIIGASALLLRETEGRRGVWVAQALALLVLLNSARALFGLVAIENETLLLKHTEGVSLLGALGTLLLCVGLLAACPDDGFLALGLSDRPAGRLLRWLVAAGIFGPIGAAVLTELAWHAGLFGAGVGVILVVLGNLLVFYRVAAVYDRADQGRRAAEERLALANADLERRVAERTAALADREAQISAIGDNLPGVMIYQTIAEAAAPFRFSYVSAGVDRISGLSSEAIMADGGLLYAQIDPDDRARLEAAERASARALVALDIEVRKHTPWGLRWSHIRSRPRRLDDRRIAWDGIEVDITAQKAVEAALERDRRYQAALFACSQALLRPGQAPAERASAMREALGYLLTGALADRIFLVRVLREPGAPEVAELIAEVNAAGVALGLEAYGPPRTPLAALPRAMVEALLAGQPFAAFSDDQSAPVIGATLGRYAIRSQLLLPLHVGGQLWGGIGLHDCSEPRRWDDQELLLLRTAAELIGSAMQRWEDEDELRRREALLETIFDLLPVGVAILDAERRPLRLNNAIAQIAGLDLAAIAGGAYLELQYIYPDGRPIGLAEFASVRAVAGEVVRDLEVGLLRPDGQVRWLSSSAAPLPVIGMGAALVVVDITERKRVEAERLAFERKLLEAQRLESLGVLAGGVAHDFNNILAAILGHAELARLDVAADSEAASSLDAIVLGARRAADLTEQMLAYAGRGRFRSEAVDLSVVARELAELTRATLPRGVAMRQHLALDLPPVLADGIQVRQVLLNLLTNAAEAIVASGKGGTITIATGRCELTAELAAEAQVGAPRPGPHGFLEVGDTGGGIDMATLGRIFDPFFTTKFTGRGLGLAAVQGIVRGHGGALFVQSAPGQGALFRACFPLADEGARARERPAPHQA